MLAKQNETSENLSLSHHGKKAWKRNLTTALIICHKYGKIESEQSVWKKKHELLKLQMEILCLHALYLLIK